MTDTRKRFLREIAQRVDPEHVVEVHLFQPMRHGGRETGVAVVAVDAAATVDPPAGDEEIAEAGAAAIEPDRRADTGRNRQDLAGTDEELAGTDEELATGDRELATADSFQNATNDPALHAGARVREARLTVYRAQYRHTLKGPERGKWELELVAEADAPLLAVDDVVRGVHRRAGEDVEPERLNGEAFRAALREERWSASAR